MPRWVIGDLLTGRRIQTVPVLSGSWSEVLNRQGDIQCTVTLRDPIVRRLGLAESATPWKAFLACIEGNTVLQAGPILEHQYEGNDDRLTLVGAGMWAYLNRRVLLPNTALNPTSPDTDTNLTSSLQGITRTWLEQMMSWDYGDVPIILPDEIAGTNERNEAGANLAIVGERVSQITDVMDGPDVHFAPRLTTDLLGVEWVARIGTPTQPQLYSAQDAVFNVGTEESSISNLHVNVSGQFLASRAYVSGGRGVLISVGEDSTLLDAGYPLLDAVDQSHSTVSEAATLDGYADEILTRGKRPVMTVSFDHDLAQRPFLSAFNVGDFAQVRIRNHSYLADGTVRMRITSRSGDAVGRKVHVELQPEVE